MQQEERNAGAMNHSGSAQKHLGFMSGVGSSEKGQTNLG